LAELALWFVLGALAVWRVTHMLHVEHGPFGLFLRLRKLAQILRAGDLVHCFYCLSVWTSAPVAYWLVSRWPDRIAVWLALSACAIVIEVKVLGGPSSVSEG
jgi:hypothetical protein